MEIVYFTLVAIALYLISDRLLDWLERRRGARFTNRSLVFFGIILTLALITFWVIRWIGGPPV